MSIQSRFIKYITIDTVSDPNNTGTIPSTKGQWDLASVLEKELKEMGADKVEVDENCIVYASFEATDGYENITPLGFIAHIDTVEGGKNIKPRVINDYDGKDVLLDSGVIIKTERYPKLASLKGRTLIVTDGTTILGGDDKAGLTAIMTMCEALSQSNQPHGKVCVAFTPDEEVGNGATKFNVEKFGAKVAATIDGGCEDDVEFENFNAASGKVKVHGVQSHPGSAKGNMVNAIRIINEFQSMLPSKQIPEETSEKEGFFHLMRMSGTVELAQSEYIIRDFDKAAYEEKKELFANIGKELNEKYGEGVIEVTITDSYFNMKEIIDQNPDLLANAEEAIRRQDMKVEHSPIRGGTDGSRLSFMGLPCINLGAGAYGFHSFEEHCTVEGMEIAAKVMMEMIRIYASEAEA